MNEYVLREECERRIDAAFKEAERYRQLWLLAEQRLGGSPDAGEGPLAPAPPNSPIAIGSRCLCDEVGLLGLHEPPCAGFGSRSDEMCEQAEREAVAAGTWPAGQGQA